MAADVDDVVDAAADPVETFVVTTGAVTSELEILLESSEAFFFFARPWCNLRSNPGIRSGMCPCTACVHHRLSVPY